MIFLLLWFDLRVLVVQANKGQSLGRWAMDLKIMDLRWQRLPTILSLSKREGILAVAAFIAMIGLKINFRDLLLMLLCLVPLIVDAISVFSDEDYNQSFHDRFSGTIVTQTRRGFSLDLKMKKLIGEAKSTWKKNRRNNQ